MLLRKFSHHLFSGQISKMWMFAGAKAYNTRDSQDVSDPSTNRAQRCLTCQIGRDGVFSARYGRKRGRVVKTRIYTKENFPSFQKPPSTTSMIVNNNGDIIIRSKERIT